MFRKIIKKIIIIFLPELKPILYQNIAFNWMLNSKNNVKLGELTKLHPPYSLANVIIGRGTYVSSNSKISHTTIGKFCSIGPNLLSGWGIHPIEGISTSPYFYSKAKQNGETIVDENLIVERKQIVIGNDVFIGANVTILDGVKIGDGAVIGAGAVVSKNIPDYAIAVGVPIRIKKYRFSSEKIEKFKKIAWWDFPKEKLKQVHSNFFNVDVFINKNF